MECIHTRAYISRLRLVFRYWPLGVVTTLPSLRHTYSLIDIAAYEAIVGTLVTLSDSLEPLTWLAGSLQTSRFIALEQCHMIIHTRLICMNQTDWPCCQTCHMWSAHMYLLDWVSFFPEISETLSVFTTDIFHIAWHLAIHSFRPLPRGLVSRLQWR